MKTTSLSEIAGQLYDRYCVAVGGKAFNGDPLPSWLSSKTTPQKDPVRGLAGVASFAVTQY